MAVRQSAVGSGQEVAESDVLEHNARRLRSAGTGAPGGRSGRSEVAVGSGEYEVLGTEYFDCRSSDLFDPCRLVRQVNQLSS